MYTRVNKDDCIACGLCSAFAEDVFDYDKEGYAYNTLDGNTGTYDIEDDTADDVNSAYEACPSEAIQVSDTPFDQ